MTAAACHNRIASFPDTRKSSPLPSDSAARERAMADAVFAAVLALQAQLSHPDPAVVMKAAGMILDLEKTRLRHGRNVVGTGDVFAATCGSGDATPTGRDEAKPVNLADPLETFVDRLRPKFQGWEDDDPEITAPDASAGVGKGVPHLSGAADATKRSRPTPCADP